MTNVFRGRGDPCYKCGELIWLQADREDMLRRSGRTFYCIWGHPQVYSKTPVETEADRIRQERDLLKQEAARLNDAINYQREQREAAERRVSAARGQITKLKKRSAEGRCPCCNRVFVDLLSHMKSKHAEYEAEPIDLEAQEQTPEQAA